MHILYRHNRSITSLSDWKRDAIKVKPLIEHESSVTRELFFSSRSFPLPFAGKRACSLILPRTIRLAAWVLHIYYHLSRTRDGIVLVFGPPLYRSCSRGIETPLKSNQSRTKRFVQSYPGTISPFLSFLFFPAHLLLASWIWFAGFTCLLREKGKERKREREREREGGWKGGESSCDSRRWRLSRWFALTNPIRHFPGESRVAAAGKSETAITYAGVGTARASNFYRNSPVQGITPEICRRSVGYKWKTRAQLKNRCSLLSCEDCVSRVSVPSFPSRATWSGYLPLWFSAASFTKREISRTF